MKKKTIGMFLVLSIILCGVIFLLCITKDNKPYIEVKAENIEEIIGKQQLLYVAIYSDECISCRKLQTDIEKIKKEGKLSKNFKLYAINIGEQTISANSIVEKYGMKGVPFILKYENGKLVNTLVNNITEEQLVEFFNQK